jgi:DNA-binding response OmpR family regulator
VSYPDPVLIFSTDDLRGGITQKRLNRSGFEVLLLSKILGARDTIAKHAPSVVIFDTYSCFSGEINQIRNLCRTLEHTAVIVLGDPSIIDRFEGPGISKELCLSNPLDPELIASKVSEVFSSKAKEKCSESDALEADLKHFLKLN